MPMIDTAFARLPSVLVRRIVSDRLNSERKIIMDHTNPSTSQEDSKKFPVTAVFIAVLIFAAVAAILVYKFPLITVLTVAFFSLMLYNLFFKRGRRGASGEQDQGTLFSQQGDDPFHNDPDSTHISNHNHVDGPAQIEYPAKSSEVDTNSHQGHHGCC